MPFLQIDRELSAGLLSLCSLAFPISLNTVFIGHAINSSVNPQGRRGALWRLSCAFDEGSPPPTHRHTKGKYPRECPMPRGRRQTLRNGKIHFSVLGSAVHGYSSSELDVSENSIIPNGNIWIFSSPFNPLSW